MRRKNPYDLGRGEFPSSVIETASGTFLLTSKRVYRLETAGGCIGDDGLWTVTRRFSPIQIEQPKIRKVT